MQTIREWLAEEHPYSIMWDGMDDAAIGVTDSMKVVYDIIKLEEIVYNSIKDDGGTYEDAVEYVEFNILCAYVGDFTPVHIYIKP